MNLLNGSRLQQHGSLGEVFVDGDGDGALVKLHRQTQPLPRPDLQRLLQHGGRLLPVGVLTQGADADLLVQVDVVPEGNRGYPARRRSLDLART